MKRKWWIIAILILSMLFIPYYWHYIKKTDYQITVITFNKMGQEVSYEEEVMDAIKSISLERAIKNKSEYKIEISLTMREYNRLAKMGVFIYPISIYKIEKDRNYDNQKNEGIPNNMEMII